MSETRTTAEADEPSPVVVDLGKKKKKAIKRLRRGEGRLVADVARVIDELKSAGTVGASAQPIIVVVKEKASRRRRGLLRG